MMNLFFQIKKSVLLLVLLCTGLVLNGQFYNGSNQEFGKNRVQYKDFVWQYIRGDVFDTYFYEGGKNLATHIEKIAEEELTLMEAKFDFPLDERLNFIVYTSQSDFRQSNVGAADVEGYNLGGKTQFIGNKLFIYFEGDYKKLRKSIRYGLATVLFNKMIMGGSWTEMMRNSTLIQLPDWFTKGIVQYMADPNDLEILSFVKDGIQSGAYDNFNRLESQETIYAGYALWYYISSVYGEAIIPNILYMTRVSRSVESGMLYALGVDLKGLLADQKYFYEQKYAAQDAKRVAVTEEPLPIKTKPYYTYSQLKANEAGTKVAFVTNELGQYKVWIYDELTGKKKRIYRGEHKLDRIIDHTYPVLGWNPTNDDLAFVVEKNGELWMYIYSTIENKVYPRQLVGVDKVLSFDYASDGKTMVMSGVRFGQTDLYLYYLLGNRQDRLTNDINDDLSPRFIDDDKRVIFTSNRDDDTLRYDGKVVLEKNQDVFVMNLAKRSDNLERITRTPDHSEKFPAQYDDKRFTYISENDGVYDKYIAEYDSVISRIDTTIHYRFFTRKAKVSNYRNNILEYDARKNSNQYTQLIYSEGQYKLYKGTLRSKDVLGQLQYEEEPQTNIPKDVVERQVIQVKGVIEDEEEREGSIDINNYQFGDEELVDTTRKVVVFEDFLDLKEDMNTSDTTQNESKPQSIRSYRVNFAKDYSVTQLTNSFNNQFYQSFTGANTLNPGLSPLMMLGMSDVFEDYRITGSLRISTDINNKDIGIAYENLLKRMDKQVVFMRMSNLYLVDYSIVKLQSNNLKYQIKWPFNEVLSLRGSINGRNERAIAAAVNSTDLDTPNFNSYSLGSKIDMVFDNTISKGINLYNGTRYKIWTEYYGEYRGGNKISRFGVTGIDFRHYERVHRDIIFAARIAGNISYGTDKLINFLGGVDNWILPRPLTDNTVPIDTITYNYRYQALVSPMRGFWRNTRNGTNAAVISAELRVPIFKYLLNRPIHSDFIENFQIIGFGDVGSAWSGLSPYSEENSFNTITSEQGSLLFEVENQIDPVVEGVGFGLRSRLFGYFVRADWAWGIVNNRVMDRVFYISFNLDF